MYYRTNTLGDDVGFIPLVTMALTSALQLKSQSDAKKIEQAKIRAMTEAQTQANQLRMMEMQFKQGSSFFSGLSPMMLAGLVGVPLVAFMLLRK